MKYLENNVKNAYCNFLETKVTPTNYFVWTKSNLPWNRDKKREKNIIFEAGTREFWYFWTIFTWRMV